MTHDAYLQSEPAQRKLIRASNIAGINVSVFGYAPKELERLTGCGSCTQACTYVAELPWGGQACRNSREKAATAALKRQIPVPFLCHMGFSCAAMPALLSKDNIHVVFLGPYCPSEAPNSLEHDAQEGLSALEQKSIEKLPFTLSDIPSASAASVPDVAQWLAETLSEDYLSHSANQKETDSAEDFPPAPNSNPKRSTTHTVHAPFEAGAIVAALVGGDTRQARLLVHSQINDTFSRRKIRMPIKRARSIAVVATVLEWAEQADADTRLCWEKFTAFQESIQQWDNEDDLTKAAIKVLSPIRRQVQEGTKKKAESKYDFVPLNTLITQHFKDGITLNTVAETLGENPTTITKRLQRTFGLSYSQYVGQMKIEHSKKLFRSTKLSISQVAQRIGLNDSANFAKLFKKHAQLTPSQFRSQFGKTANKQERTQS